MAAAGVKRRLRCEGTRGDQSNKALQTTAKNLDLILMQERPRHIAVEGVGSGVEILSLPCTSCVALDNLLNLSV